MLIELQASSRMFRGVFQRLPARTDLRGLFLLLATIASVGCQRTPYELAPVHGSVTIDGAPFVEGKVMFAPVGKADNASPGKPALGRLQRDGSFELSTYQDKDGAVVGEHTATIIQIEPRITDVAHTSASGGTAGGFPRFRRARVPGRFEVVGGQDNHFDIKLTRQDITRYKMPD